MSRIAENIIISEEGYRQHPYYCSEQVPTIGYGRVIGKKGDPLPAMTTTKQDEIKFVREKIREISFQLQSKFPVAWMKCNETRQAILISMVYQMGLVGVSAFQQMWKALEFGNFERASKEMLNSKWAKQTPNRAKRHSDTMLRGDRVQYYLSQGQIP